MSRKQYGSKRRIVALDFYQKIIALKVHDLGAGTRVRSVADEIIEHLDTAVRAGDTAQTLKQIIAHKAVGVRVVRVRNACNLEKNQHNLTGNILNTHFFQVRPGLVKIKPALVGLARRRRESLVQNNARYKHSSIYQ
jgi:hypothetical protein